MIEMGLTSLQVCMDATHWLEHDDSGMDSSSNSPSGDMLGCPRPLMERRLRPQHDQPLKCPRCDSAHTKFCYYNNYSLSQPRYFCKTCRRYWTKGGTLRNIPVGGGCRKNKKVSSSKKPTDNGHLHHNQMMNVHPPVGVGPDSSSPTDLQLSFPRDMHFTSHINSLLASNNASFCTNPSSFMEAKFGSAPGPIDFMDSKLEALVGSSNTRNNNNNYDFMGNHHNNVMDQQGQFGDFNGGGFGLMSHFNNGLCSPNFGVNNNSMIDGGEPSYIMDQQSYNHGGAGNSIDVKPNPKLLSLEWHDQNNCSDVGKMMMMNGTTSYNINGYNNFNSLGSSWTVNMMNDFGSSATNPLV